MNRVLNISFDTKSEHVLKKNENSGNEKRRLVFLLFSAGVPGMPLVLQRQNCRVGTYCVELPESAVFAAC
jgi:hypothetical protein